MKNILVTGATSFIGVYLLNELLKDKEYNIYVILRKNSKNSNKISGFRDIHIIPLDLCEISNLNNYVDHIDICFHLAWNGVRVPERYNDVLQETNYKYSIDTYETVKALGCSVFIGGGSQAEYGYCKDSIKEETPTVPNTAYGKYKLYTCNKLIDLGIKDGIRVIWGRIFSVYGKGDFENTLITSCIRKMKLNESIDLTEGTQYWNYLYVEDLARILVALKNNNKACGIYNLASDDTRMLKDYILDLKRVLNSESKINFGAVPYRTEGKVNIMPSIEKLKQCIPGISFVKFNEAVRQLL